MTNEAMRAIVVREFGAADVLKVENVARPMPEEGQVLVRVHAAGVNPIDWKFRKGLLAALRGFELPWTPGTDIAGVVESIGPGVRTLRPGDEVLGQSATGAYAEFATALESCLTLKPKRLSWDEAASIPVGANTAWQGLFEHGGLQAGQRVLVQGAAGGVGQLAVQLARWKGAHVIGTASTANLDFVKALGANEAIDYTTTKVEDVLNDVDLVFDTIGGATYDASLKTLRRGGTIVSLVGAPPEEGAAALGVRLVRMNAQTRGDVLKSVAELVEAGTIQVNVGETFPLAQAARAHEQSEHGHGRGRIVLHAIE